jgi:hypothetical protein
MHIQSKHAKLASAILKLIESQRNGETIDQTLVKKVVDSFGMCYSHDLRHLLNPHSVTGFGRIRHE